METPQDNKDTASSALEMFHSTNLANVLLEVSEGRRDDGVPAQLAAGGHRHRDHYLREVRTNID